MKTLFMVVSLGTSARNMLRTDVFKDLRRNPIRIVLLVPQKLVSAFAKDFASENVIVEGYPPHRKIERAFLFLRYITTLLPGIAFPWINTNTYRLKHDQLKLLIPVRYRLYRFLFYLQRVPGWKALVRWADWLVVPKKWYQDLFAKYSPDAVFSTNAMNQDEYYIAEYARKKRIPIIGNVLSWDNLTSKGDLPYFPDTMIVWNDTMQKELLTIHDFPKDRIVVAGAPQFDIYFRHPAHMPTRDAFLKKIGADPTKKIVTYCCGAAGETTEFQKHVVSRLAAMAEQQSLGHPFQLVIRPHPRSDPGTFVPFRGRKDIIVTDPAQKPQAAAGAFVDSWNPDENDMLDLCCILKYSDVVVNFSSTITIDACAVGTPVVNVCFGDKPDTPYIKSARRVFDYDHFRNLMDSGAFKVAYDEQVMVDAINQYLDHPDLDKEQRRALAEQQCFKRDGNAGHRIAACVLDVLKIKT